MSAERVRPIRPEEIAGEKVKSLPDEVLSSFNELLIQNDRGGRTIVKQDDVIAIMVNKGLDQDQIFKNGWLDVEDIYRKEGWKVEYDKPAYNEDYPARFIFSRPK